MASLQALVNNFLVWHSSCESPLNSQSICPAACQSSAYNQNIEIGQAWETKASLRYLLLVCVSVELVYGV